MRTLARKRRLLLWLVFCLSIFPAIVPAQAQVEALVTLTVQDAGYDRAFRPEHWMPVRVRLRNNGDALSGLLTVRPDTSGGAVANSYSTPVTLPNGADQNVFLYVVPRVFSQQLRVELLDSANNVIAFQQIAVRPLPDEDHLYVVITGGIGASVDLTRVSSGGRTANQANWDIADIPTYASALDALDVLFFNDVDTNPLSGAQRSALLDWVLAGGHMLVMGGGEPGALDTAAGLSDLLPFTPQGSRTLPNLTPLAAWAGYPQDTLTGQIVVATGTAHPDAEILAALNDGTPLLLRRRIGAGTVDYLAVNPTTAALRDWGRLDAVWSLLFTSVDPRPAWSGGLLPWRLTDAAAASEILPGASALPDVLALCGFLSLYIALVGPVNYILLARINRREWAWFTIPLLIVLFSLLSWVVGFNLRGNEATISRLTVVQSWAGQEHARAEQLIGMLSPRRSSYTLTMTDASTPLLRPIIGSPLDAPLTTSARVQADIVQTDRFLAEDFSVDASIIASFNASATIQRPPVSGQVSIFYDSGGAPQMRGSVRNDGTEALLEPVILARGTVIRLPETLPPGGLQTFEVALNSSEHPAPSALERPTQAGTTSPQQFFRASGAVVFNAQDATIRDILGETNYALSFEGSRLFEGETPQEQDYRRRRLFLSSFIGDNYLSSGRGSGVYLVAWLRTSPLELTLEGASWQSSDLTLYIVELETNLTLPDAPVTITPDQFTWVAEERSGTVVSASPFDVRLFQDDSVTFRLTPLNGYVLAEVSELVINVQQGQGARASVRLEVWDWVTQQWVEQRVIGSSHSIPNPGGLIGPRNAVRIRLAQEVVGGILEITRLDIAQRGTF